MKRPATAPDRLALLGGKPARARPFPRHPIIGKKEKQAVMNVLNKGCLSGFPYDFLGGPNVRDFEKKFADYFGVQYAVAVNSGTAALHVAVAGAGINPGDEVIVPCYTFTASATAVMHHNAIPVFVDVDPKSFCVTAELIEAAITPRTRAIIAVHLLGNACLMDDIMELARRHHLVVIEDNAQSPGVKYRGRWAGTWGDAGTFSFVETKNMVTGEGGMVITNQKEIADRCRLIRNHGECHVAGKPRSYVANILGWNYRMTEIEAALGVAQLSQLTKWNKARQANAEYLTQHLRLPGLTPPFYDPRVDAVCHIYNWIYDESKVGLPRALFQKAIIAEGIPCTLGYPHPLYRNPIFQKDAAYKSLHCSTAEKLCREGMLWTNAIRPPATLSDMRDVVDAFQKVYGQRDLLRGRQEEGALK